ncbi:MAG: DUF4445 domain-containing protein [Burkholderiales bacterium]|nr:DUF4445 domain-containing protein [Burkholderiales bacterium]
MTKPEPKAGGIGVSFLPDSRQTQVAEGDHLLLAALKAGVGIKSVCGGRGKCGSCLVELEPADAAALSPAGDEEIALLPPAREGKYYRLACMAKVRGALRVAIPPESQALKSPPRKPYTVTRIALAPAVKRVALDVEGAYVEPLRPLATRITAALARAGQGKVELPLAALAEFSHEPDFDSSKDVSATIQNRRVLQLSRGKPRTLYGLALDIGTTSIVVFLCNLERGDIAAVRTASNPQAAYGEDVISRMTHIYSDVAMLATLQKLLVDEINRMVADAAQEAGVALADIADAVVVGNPTMQHILLGINPAPLGRGPYLPVLCDGVEVEAASMGLAMMPRAPVFVLPMPAGYIGGDTVSAVLTRGPEFYRGNNLLVDIGTNGEVVLAKDGVLTATSCATGPVYEGAHIACGVRAAPGAIERVWVEDGRNLRWAAIPPDGERDKRPVGLCGSGVISTVTALAGAGLIGSDGAFAAAGSHPRIRASAKTRQLEALLVPGMGSRTGRDIVFTQQDVRAVQLGKAALRAGIEILLREEGVTQLDHIYLAGTFGNHLEPRDIVAIGLVPPLPVERIESIGNAAGDGARMALFNRRERRRAHKLAHSMRVVELSNRADFQDMFVAATELSDATIDLEGA